MADDSVLRPDQEAWLTAAGPWYEWFRREGRAELRTILLEQWDPIGVWQGGPEAEDESDAYIGPIANRLRQGTGYHDIAGYLSYVTTDLIGLRDNTARDAEVARRIVAWYEAAMLSHRPAPPSGP